MSDTPITLDDPDAWDSISGRGNPQERFRVYRLCECGACQGSGKGKPSAARATGWERCPECRGEGKVRELLAAAPDAGGLGAAIIELGREGAFAECPIGVLDTEGEKGQKWLVLPWLPSARNVSDAGRTLARAKGAK